MKWLERGALCVAATFVLILFVKLAVVEIQDPDLWLHKAAGEWILAHGHVPTVDPFSCTQLGQPWHVHEWLFQVIVALVWSHLGLDALIVGQAIIFLIILALVFSFRLNQGHYVLRILCLLALVVVFPVRLTLRPDMISLLMVTLFLWTLDGFWQRRWVLPLLILGQVIWVNAHGFYVLGPWLVFLWGVVGRNISWRWFSLLALLLLACVFNPFGINTFIFPLSTVTSFLVGDSPFLHDILEAANPIFSSDWHTVHFIVYRFVVALSGVSLIFLWGKKDYLGIAISIFAILFSFLGVRNIPYFVIFEIWVLMRCLNYMPIIKYPKIAAIGLCGWMVWWSWQQITDIALRGYIDPITGKYHSMYEGGVSSRVNPVRGVDFLADHQVKGNFFNDVNAGTYLIARMYPAIHVFIDNRTDLYEGAFYRAYKNIYFRGDRGLFDTMVAKYQLTGVFLSTVDNRYVPVAFLRMIAVHPDWRLVYFDHDAIIFLKKDTVFQGLTTQVGSLNQMATQAFTRDSLRQGYRDASFFVSRAYHLVALGRWNLAEREIIQALAIEPNSFDAMMLGGMVLKGKGHYAKALELFTAILRRYPSNPQALYNVQSCRNLLKSP